LRLGKLTKKKRNYFIEPYELFFRLYDSSKIVGYVCGHEINTAACALYDSTGGFYCGFDTKLYQSPRKNRAVTGTKNLRQPQVIQGILIVIAFDSGI